MKPCKPALEFCERLHFDWPKIWRQCEDSCWMIWGLSRTGNLDKPLAVQIAIACAEHVLPLFEKKYPNDQRPRRALEAAKAWLANPCEATRSKAAAAAAAAYGTYVAIRAAYAAAAAAAAANAAYAANAAAYAAAAYTGDAATYDAPCAADASAYAAAAANAAAAAKAASAIKAERKWQADTIREIVGPVEFVMPLRDR